MNVGVRWYILHTPYGYNVSLHSKHPAQRAQLTKCFGLLLKTTLPTKDEPINGECSPLVAQGDIALGLSWITCLEVLVIDYFRAATALPVPYLNYGNTGRSLDPSSHTLQGSLWVPRAA